MSDSVEANEDYLVQRHEAELAAEEAAARAERDAAKQVVLAPSGRWAVGHIALGVGLAMLLIWGTAAAYDFVRSPGFREGFGQGMADSHPVVSTPAATTPVP